MIVIDNLNALYLHLFYLDKVEQGTSITSLFPRASLYRATGIYLFLKYFITLTMDCATAGRSRFWTNKLCGTAILENTGFIHEVIEHFLKICNIVRQETL